MKRFMAVGAALCGLVVMGAFDGSAQPARGHASTAKPIVQVYKSATCGCCKEWMKHMQAAGFDVRAQDLEGAALEAQKTKLGVAENLRSCHTAVVGGYVVEGHVPAADIQRLLKTKPAVVGVAAPGMPRGSPGMEMPGGTADRYEVIAFAKGGKTSVYASH